MCARIVYYVRGEILSGMVLVMTHSHNSVRVEGGIWTMSPIVVVEGPVFVGVGLMLRTAHSPPPHYLDFATIRTLPSV